MKNNLNDLKEKLSTITFVCTTADCWTARRRSFMGITVHWIEPETLQRSGACLGIRQITGSHTYDVLAKTIESVGEEFGILDKISRCVTDSGSNFMKAFKHFSRMMSIYHCLMMPVTMRKRRRMNSTC